MSTKNPISNILGSLFALIFVIIPFVFIIPYKIHDSDFQVFFINIGNLRYIGLIPVILGSCMILWCYWYFIFYGKGTPMHFIPPKKFVAKGLYRYMRNPMILGGFITVIGEALLFESSIILIYVLVFFLFWQPTLMFIEEPQLRKRFGKSYINYCKEVHRWIPRLTPYKKDS